MKITVSIIALTLSTMMSTTAIAQASANAPVKPVLKTTCAEYVALNETVKPQFIYYVVGHAQNGKPEAIFEEDAIVTIKPELDKFCSINLTKSAYEQVIASSVASEKAYKKQRAAEAK